MGISRSVALGTEAAQKAAPDGLLFMVCDQPWLREATLKSMLEGYNGGILALKCREQAGNPVIFPREYFEELKALFGRPGADGGLCSAIKTGYNFWKLMIRKNFRILILRKTLRKIRGKANG